MSRKIFLTERARGGYIERVAGERNRFSSAHPVLGVALLRRPCRLISEAFRLTDRSVGPHSARPGCLSCRVRDAVEFEAPWGRLCAALGLRVACWRAGWGGTGLPARQPTKLPRPDCLVRIVSSGLSRPDCLVRSVSSGLSRPAAGGPAALQPTGFGQSAGPKMGRLHSLCRSGELCRILRPCRRSGPYWICRFSGDEAKSCS
jgi:hypothetical protein